MIKTLIAASCLFLLPGMASAQASMYAAMSMAMNSAESQNPLHVLKPLSPAQAAALRVRAGLLITTLSHGQERVVRVFAGPDGLLGAVIENTANEQDIAWMTPHADALLAGSLWGLRGEELTRVARLQQGLLLTPKAVLSQAMEPARPGVFVVGTGGPVITVFFDPNCIYCHQLYGALAPEIAAGHLRVRFVIVGTFKASSTPRAASLLAAADPVQALALNESQYDTAKEEGGFPIATTIPAPLTAAVQANSTLFGKAGFNGTPVILYCNKAGAVQANPGVPSDLNKFLSSTGECR